MDFLRRWLLIVVVPLFCLASGCKQGSWPLWNAYSTRFVNAQGRVFDPRGDQHTTSECQADAMFFAVVANDRARFDRIENWSRTNLAQGDLGSHLPARRWGKDQNGSWGLLDSNSSSDADVWMAYSLLEAGRLWNVPRYASAGRSLLALIAKKEVVNLPGFGVMLLPGASGYQHEQSWVLNPSHVPLFLFERLAVVDPAGPWREIAQNVPRLLEQSAQHGFAMDWVEYVPGDGFYPLSDERLSKPGDEANGAAAGYDAMRVYLWAGMQDEDTPVRGRLVNAVYAMNGFLGTHDAPPQRVDDRGIPESQPGPVGFSAAVLPYLRAFPGRSPVSAQQMIRMSLMRDDATGLYGKEMNCEDQNLALFATGYVDGLYHFGPAGELRVGWNW